MQSCASLAKHDSVDEQIFQTGRTELEWKKYNDNQVLAKNNFELISFGRLGHGGRDWRPKTVVRVDADAIGRHCEVRGAHGSSIQAMATTSATGTTVTANASWCLLFSELARDVPKRLVQSGTSQRPSHKVMTEQGIYTASQDFSSHVFGLF